MERKMHEKEFNKPTKIEAEYGGFVSCGKLFKQILEIPAGQRNTKQLHMLAEILCDHPFFKGRELKEA